MRRYLPLILFTGLALGQDFNQKGYLRNLEASICMSHCGAYYLEDELGYFLNYISDENDSLNLEYYLNRFVNIEGDSISCTFVLRSNNRFGWLGHSLQFISKYNSIWRICWSINCIPN